MSKASGRQPHHTRALNLALQGGGAHGAFTWGVLDKIFDGSTELLLTQLVSDRKLDPDELRRLRSLLDERLTVRKRRS